ncbi:MAG: phosphotransferase, partial [Pseudomonadales bacterium]|nr:phosphotransferase [Pseudomonadales bacterium]
MHFSISAELESTLLRLTNADALAFDAVIQSLWSGYGQIIRLRLYGAEMPSVVVKLVSLCKVEQHPRGWNSELAHQRKLQSYHVEAYWYQQYAMQCDSACRVARCYGCVIDEQQLVLVLEDLDASGFDGRVEAKSQHSLMMLQACLRWLAHLHGKFLRPNINNLKCQDSAVAVPESSQAGLWPTGSYWHLSTRPDEWAALPDGELKRYAAALDSALRHSDYHTLIHGDAKLANFCFKTLPKTQAIDVAAVDFQYLGWGCGMRDVAYCISSALEASQCSAQSEALLDYYFQQLRFAIERYQPSMTETAVDGVVKQ